MLPTELRPAVAANLITHADPIRRGIGDFDSSELAETFRLATGASFEAVLASVEGREPEVRSSAAVNYLQRSFDEADVRWDDRRIKLVIEKVLTGSAVDQILPWLVERLDEGHTASVRAGRILGFIFATQGATCRASVEGDLVAAVRRVLPEAQPEAAGALGVATNGLADKTFEDVLKAMRSTGEQRPKAAVEAFIAARRAT